MIHGGDIYTEGLLKGRKLLDYSSNINALGVPKSFSENINEAVKNVQRYPDIKYRNLIKNLMEYTNFSAEHIVLGNGASEIIDRVVALFKSILIVVPSFLEYEIDAKNSGLHIEYSYLKDTMEIDYFDIENKIKNVDAVIIGNPNNPTGKTIDKNEFYKIMNYCESEKKIIIIDESFIEFTCKEEDSFQDELKNYSCLFIIRAITKFFALPGVRFGYGMCKSDKLYCDITRKQNPWNINCFAELAVKYCLNDNKYIEKSKDLIKSEREDMVKKLKTIGFIEKVYDTKANFVLCKLRGLSCDNLYEKCLEDSIVIRKADNFKGLNKNFIRLAIKNDALDEKLIKTLKKIEGSL
ncbi:MAG: histidinol-phosphate transaminase [Clostridium sp.]|nr:histidinol-phosphate transaminase [Clostridium sp.]